MTTWSDQDVRFNGVSVMCKKYWMSDRSGLDMTPGFRSTNFDVAYLAGTMWRPKQIPEVVRSVAFTIDSCDDDGNYPVGALARKAQLNLNRLELFSLVSRENAQVTVERDVLMPDGMGGTELETWTGYMQVMSPITPQMPEDFDDHMTLGMDMGFADPTWYGAEIVENISGSETITNPGTIAATNLTIEFAGGSGYRLTNAATEPDDTWVQVDDSGSIELDVRNTTAIKNGTTNVIAALTRFGSREWMRLEPGDNPLTLTGGGSATITYRVPRT